MNALCKNLRTNQYKSAVVVIFITLSMKIDQPVV